MTAQERKAEERTARRQRIQRAAREVFDDKGYARASIEQIARRAELSVGAIYLYFKTKDDLYLSLVNDVLATLATELRCADALAGESSSARLASAWDRLIAWAESHPESARALRQLSQPQLSEQLSEQVIGELADGLATIKEGLASLLRGVAQSEEHAAELASVLWMGWLGVLAHHETAANLGQVVSLRSLAAPLIELVAGVRMPRSVAAAA